MQFRPCIDIRKGKVTQVVGSTLSDSKLDNEDNTVVSNFETERSSASFAELYKKDKLIGGHVIMLGREPANQQGTQSDGKGVSVCDE